MPEPREPLLYHGPGLAADTSRPPDALFLPGRHGTPDRGWLADPAQKTTGQLRYVGISVVAGWLGISPQTLAAKVKRHSGTEWQCPVEDARLRPPRSTSAEYDRFWLSNAARRREWDEWYGSLPGRGRPGKSVPGRGNRAKNGKSVPALAGPKAIESILAQFPLCAPARSRLKVLAAMDAAGGRLLVTGTGADRMVWALSQADADAASAAMPDLVFAPR